MPSCRDKAILQVAGEWIPAFAGMTDGEAAFAEMTVVQRSPFAGMTDEARRHGATSG